MARTKGSVGTHTAQRILDESLPLIAGYGYAAVSMRMIADKVGVNVSAIYNHFPSKQQILVTLMSDHMRDLIAAWKETDTSGLSAAEKLDTFARFHIRFNTKRPDAVFISFMELRSLEAGSHKFVEKQRRAYEHELRNIIKQGIESKEFNTEDAHVAAMSILASLTGVNTWFREQGRLSKSKIEDYYAAMALRSVGFNKEL